MQSRLMEKGQTGTKEWGKIILTEAATGDLLVRWTLQPRRHRRQEIDDSVEVPALLPRWELTEVKPWETQNSSSAPLWKRM